MISLDIRKQDRSIRKRVSSLGVPSRQWLTHIIAPSHGAHIYKYQRKSPTQTFQEQSCLYSTNSPSSWIYLFIYLFLEAISTRSQVNSRGSFIWALDGGSCLEATDQHGYAGLTGNQNLPGTDRAGAPGKLRISPQGGPRGPLTSSPADWPPCLQTGTWLGDWASGSRAGICGGHDLVRVVSLPRASDFPCEVDGLEVGRGQFRHPGRLSFAGNPGRGSRARSCRGVPRQSSPTQTQAPSLAP